MGGIKMSESCVTCRYFDPNYHNGYCDDGNFDTSPSGYCPNYRPRPWSQPSRTCASCTHYDADYNYCNDLRINTNASSSCSNYSER